MAYLITDPDFITADNLDESKYKDVTMGKKEGEVMKDLIYKHGFFRRTESIDFQGICSISPYAPPVCNSSLSPLSTPTLFIYYCYLTEVTIKCLACMHGTQWRPLAEKFLSACRFLTTAHDKLLFENNYITLPVDIFYL
jgi:hypothetical protein